MFDVSKNPLKINNPQNYHNERVDLIIPWKVMAIEPKYLYSYGFKFGFYQIFDRWALTPKNEILVSF